MKPMTKTLIIATTLYLSGPVLQSGLALYGIYSLYKDTSASDLRKNLEMLIKII